MGIGLVMVLDPSAFDGVRKIMGPSYVIGHVAKGKGDVRFS
jgi:phosphoribosylaminoimidazole (AIR) synthetase